MYSAGTGDPAVGMRVPDLGAPVEELQAYRDKAFSKSNILRVRRLEDKVRNLLYFYGRQWIELDASSLVSGSRGFVFRNIKNSDKDIPRPVSNYIAPAVNMELSSLGRRQLTANVLARSRDPRAEAAAEVAKEILEDRLQKLSWPDLREHFTWLDIVCGISVLKSYWDETSTEVSYTQNPEAKMCLECGTKVASSQVEEEEVAKAEAEGKVTRHSAEAPREEEAIQSTGGKKLLNLPSCPTCEAPVEMAPMELDPESAQELDYYNRPLGTVVPKGNTAIEVVSIFDYYPENGGIVKDWNSVTLHRQATARSVDWILSRYPHLKGHVQAENPKELMRNHPVLGEWDIFQRYEPKHDADLFSDHAMVYEVWQDRNWRFPQGRGFVLIGDCPVAAYDGPLYKRAQGSQVEAAIVRYAGANWEPRHMEIWGKALPDDMISPQNRINMMDSLELEAIGRMGSPNIIFPDGCGTNGPEWFDDGQAKVIRYSTDPLNPGAKPEVLEGHAMPPNAQNARKQAVEDIRAFGGPTDFEQGEAVKNITTTSAYQLLGENSEKKRAHRERSLISAFEKIWEHQLELLWAFRVDDDSYEAEGHDGAWERKQYNRLSIMGMTKVKIEKQAEVDKSLYQKEAVREAMADGLYITSSPQSKKRILELRGLPQDVNEDINYQIDNVKKQWVDFVEEGKVPVMDPSLDDPTIRFNGFATFLLSEEGQQLGEVAGWPQVLKKISGWEIQVQQMEAMDLATRQTYGNDPQAAQQLYQQAELSYQEQQGAYEQGQHAIGEMVQESGMPPPPGMVPPQPPAPVVYLPGDKADHIYGVWMQMLGGGAGMEGMLPQLPQLPQESDSYLRMRALVEAYRLLAEQKLMQAQLAAPGVNPDGGSPIAPDAAGGVPQLGQLNVAQKGIQ